MSQTKRLLTAILIQTLHDLQHPLYQTDAHAFVCSEWFDEVAEAVGLHPARVRRLILSGQFDLSHVRAVHR